jgi:prepilin signal peptidase PulO-like enzyme (type II secretory pathway)
MNLFLIFFIGALLGSFFYTLAVRFTDGSFTKNKVEALFGFSKCPCCNHRIKAVYLLPVIGFLIARGKCTECGRKISFVYPLAEILFGLLAIIINKYFGLNIYSIIIFLIICVSITASIIDIKSLVLPDHLIIAFLILSIYPILYNNSVKDSLYGLLLMGGFFIIVLLIFPGSFGGGDVKFAASIGMLLGFELSIVALETALVAGSIAGVVYVIITKRGLRIKLPFGPFLTAGLIVALLFGREILYIYYRIVF